MSKRLKGLAGEELPAALFAIILLLIFLTSSLAAYSNYYSRAGFIEQERIASSLAQKILSDSQGVVSNPDSVLAQHELQNARIELRNLETGQTWARGSIEGLRDVAASSLALLIESGEKYYPGRVDVYVGK